MPRDEFAAALKAIGMQIDGEHPHARRQTSSRRGHRRPPRGSRRFLRLLWRRAPSGLRQEQSHRRGGALESQGLHSHRGPKVGACGGSGHQAPSARGADPRGPSRGRPPRRNPAARSEAGQDHSLPGRQSRPRPPKASSPTRKTKRSSSRATTPKERSGPPSISRKTAPNASPRARAKKAVSTSWAGWGS